MKLLLHLTWDGTCPNFGRREGKKRSQFCVNREVKKIEILG